MQCTTQQVDSGLNMYEVGSVFGQYVKFVTTSEKIMPSSTSSQNAFDILLASQVSLSQRGRPPLVDVKNAKDQLYNSIIEYFEKQELDWRSDEIKTQGHLCVRKLTEVLWILDGHHHVLSKQCCHVPDTFHGFQGYNNPTQHKHRKRVISNLESGVLQKQSSSLFDLLHAPFWSLRKWQAFRGDVELLAKSLNSYSEYLKSQSSKQKLSHDSIEPVRSFANGISVKVLQQNAKSHPCLDAVEHALVPMDAYTYLSLESYLPEDSQQQYAFIRRLEGGLNVSCVLLTYSVGNNIGNFHFVRKCTGNESSIIENSQPTIEAVKQLLPVYHTRATRKQIQVKFGRLSQKVKPCEFRFIFNELTGDCTQGQRKR